MKTPTSPSHVPFAEERSLFEQELDAHFAAPGPDIVALERELHAQSAQLPHPSPYRVKVLGYRLISERCPVRVFRHCPFYFELNTARPRTDLGTGGLGGWMKREPFGEQLTASSVAWLRPCAENGLSIGWAVLDDNHHTVGYEKILRLGFRGIIREAEAQLATAVSPKERDFLEAAIAGNHAMIRVGERLADEADRLARAEADPRIRRRLERIAATARRVPAEPAATFYEAINTILFVFYTFQAIEGNGISVFGHVDRILEPYYRADLAAGRMTADEARDLVGRFLAVSDARYGMREAAPWHCGTNGTVTLGGCDRDGNPVYNEVTRLVLDMHRELQLIDPKVNARISSRHPQEYFERLAAFNAGGGNSLSVFNDDVIIAANARMGKAEADCRLYVGGGCQENVLEECEINSRATIYLNLLQVFQMGFFPEQWDYFFRRAGITPAGYSGCNSFEAFYAAFLDNLKTVVALHVDERNRTEREGVRFNPCPLHSSTLGDCLARRLDMMEGGCRYSFGSIALTGIGTLVDSLFAVRTAIYDRRLLPMEQLTRMLATNFEGEESFRAFLANRIPKFGQDDPGIRSFAAQVFADAARVSSGQPNSRGGRYEASLFAFRSFTSFGTQTGATPDGRRAGEFLSPGMSPSLLALGKDATAGPVLDAIAPLDLSRYPVVAVLDVKMPLARGGPAASVLVPVFRRFLETGGSVLQVNCVDPETLREARAHPERYPDLVVRVSGYSSYFVRLAEPIQDEIIARTLVKA